MRPISTNKLAVVANAIVPITQKVKMGELLCDTSLGKSMRPYQRNKIKAKRM